jgi:hypothetical protein
MKKDNFFFFLKRSSEPDYASSLTTTIAMVANITNLPFNLEILLKMVYLTIESNWQTL